MNRPYLTLVKVLNCEKKHVSSWPKLLIVLLMMPMMSQVAPLLLLQHSPKFHQSQLILIIKLHLIRKKQVRHSVLRSNSRQETRISLSPCLCITLFALLCFFDYFYICFLFGCCKSLVYFDSLYFFSFFVFFIPPSRLHPWFSLWFGSHSPFPCIFLFLPTSAAGKGKLHFAKFRKFGSGEHLFVFPSLCQVQENSLACSSLTHLPQQSLLYLCLCVCLCMCLCVRLSVFYFYFHPLFLLCMCSPSFFFSSFFLFFLLLSSPSFTCVFIVCIHNSHPCRSK